MAVRDANYWQLRAFYSVGGPSPNGPAPTDPLVGPLLTSLASMLPDLYQDAVMEAAGAVNAPGVQLVYAYLRKACVEYLMGALAPKVNARLGRFLMVQAQEKFANYQRMLAAIEKDVEKYEARAKGVRPPVVAALIQSSPNAPQVPLALPGPGQPTPFAPGFVGPANPNDPRFYGMPAAGYDPNDPSTW